MSRRIDVELTSERADGCWTWRAAGAKQPKGELDASLLYEGARVGDVVRAEADFAIEGIAIVSVLPPKAKKQPESERVEIVGPPRDTRGVISSVTSTPERSRPDRSRPREDGRRDQAGRADQRRPTTRRDGGARPGEPGRRDDGDQRVAGDGRRDSGAPARRGGGPTTRGDGGPRPPRARPDAPGGTDRAPRAARGDAAASAPRAKRFHPGSAHRDAVLAGLPPEQRPIAEQALRGGLPRVRQAVEAQNAGLREQGQPEVKAGPFLAIAEQLLPQLKAAEWRDRAEAAAAMIDEMPLRDLRSVVIGADMARDEEGRLLAGTLREAMERRLKEQYDAWITDITGALDDGRLVRALRVSGRPPDPGTRFPAELAVRLSQAAGSAMAADAPPDRWQALLEAVIESPVRRTVKPAALPSEAPEGVLQIARQASGKVPALAGLLGITMPPPPGPPRAVRPGATGARPRRSPAERPRPPIPPPPAPPLPATHPEVPTIDVSTPGENTGASDPVGPSDPDAVVGER